eukprot:3818386-Rhodomonas_salina.2
MRPSLIVVPPAANQTGFIAAKTGPAHVMMRVSDRKKCCGEPAVNHESKAPSEEDEGNSRVQNLCPTEMVGLLCLCFGLRTQRVTSLSTVTPTWSYKASEVLCRERIKRHTIPNKVSEEMKGE